MVSGFGEDIPGRVASEGARAIGGLIFGSPQVDQQAAKKSLQQMGINNPSQQQIQNFLLVADAAKAHGVPGAMLLGIAKHEGNFLTDPGGNGGGMGQFIDTTARGYGATQQQLRSDPKRAADLMAQLLSDNYKATGGKDWNQAAAAYFVGADNVNQAIKAGGPNWLPTLDQVAKKYNQGTVSAYLTSIGASGAIASAGGGAGGTGTNWGGGGAASRTSVRLGPNGEPPRPDPSDPQYQDNYSQYLADTKTWEELYGQGRADTREALWDQHLDLVLKQMSNQISAGTLSVDAASKQFSNILSAEKAPYDIMSQDFFKYGAPAGAKYIPGTEPGNAANRPAQPITGGIGFNPFQVATELKSQIPDYAGMASRFAAPSSAPLPAQPLTEAAAPGEVNPNDPNNPFWKALESLRNGLVPANAFGQNG